MEAFKKHIRTSNSLYVPDVEQEYVRCRIFPDEYNFTIKEAHKTLLARALGMYGSIE